MNLLRSLIARSCFTVAAERYDPEADEDDVLKVSMTLCNSLEHIVVPHGYMMTLAGPSVSGSSGTCSMHSSMKWTLKNHYPNLTPNPINLTKLNSNNNIVPNPGHLSSHTNPSP